VDKFQVKMVVMANVEVVMEVEAEDLAAARNLALDGGGKAISQEIDWESVNVDLVDVDGEWVDPDDME